MVIDEQSIGATVGSLGSKKYMITPDQMNSKFETCDER